MKGVRVERKGENDDTYEDRSVAKCGLFRSIQAAKSWTLTDAENSEFSFGFS
jgi:hypothetical protein